MHPFPWTGDAEVGFSRPENIDPERAGNIEK
jgi:hypothetical protein